MRNFLILVLLGFGVITFSGCGPVVAFLTPDEIKQNQEVAKVEMVAAAQAESVEEAREHIVVGLKSLGIVAGFIGSPDTPVPHDHEVAAKIQEAGEEVLKDSAQLSEWLGKGLGWAGTVLPWLAPALAGLGMFYKRYRTFKGYFDTVVTGIYDTVKAGKDGYTKEELYKAIGDASKVIGAGTGFAKEVAIIKSELKSKEEEK